MSLSTLLEAAKYLDYLDSNNRQQQQQQIQFQPHQPQQISKKPARRQRASKKNAANAMIAMSLPASTGPLQMQGVPIPMISSNDNHQAASLSSSFTTGSPLSSFASTALLCSKASGVTSNSSSAASSLSSSDSSSSCGEILMGDHDFNQSNASSSGKSNDIHGKGLSNNNNNNNNHHNYHLTHQKIETHDQPGNQQFNNNGSNDNNQSIARYIAATSAGPQLVTMTASSSGVASASAPIDGSIRAGHVIHAANNHGAIKNTSSGSSFEARHFSLATGSGVHNQQALACGEGQTYSVASNSFGSDSHLSSSPGSYPPLIMARVQPMILSSLSPSAQSIMAFQPATASSPTSSTSSYSRHRELHKTLEKNRRAHLRHCFELLKAELPASECVDKKTSHINIIKSAIRYVLALRQQESEIDDELLRLTKIKNELTENLSKMSAGQAPQKSHQQTSEALKQDNQPQQPAEQQLSFLLSQSKID